ncbi:U3 small nucleolar RNA-associated protein 15 [Elasticomyces elasticus]|nr:U3 small nucleolar RNA-associated protein 15 [Elasticomyces elasticus]KAK3630883.1 U3 small nucleolar RNA-associated protein 15 [Elasticomyces elasticus]KAK4909287.1 U3 small nucleolar RNA-associated protein 15 [Elasticomyces elasticus]KAK5753565.1 U3 small nucleolar RNA-associated protein 15 [Elasticomyces elasticus]
MAAEVQPLPQLRAAPGPAPLTADQAYWKTFKNQLLLPSPHNSGITSITIPDHNPTGAQTDTFAVTSGGRVQIYNGKTRKLGKTISRFGVDDTARSGVLRRDGRILLAGGDSGVVQAFDTGSRAILRQWRGEHAHKQAVHVVRWNPSVLTDLMSASDDRTVRVWDLTDDVAKWTGVGHEDYVRSACYLPGQDGMIATGSYDQTVRLWDTRQPGNNRPALSFKHAAPVEDVVPLSSSVLASAAGNEVTVLDLIAGKASHILRSHQKNITSLTTGQNGTRLLSGGLDGHVKVYNTTSWEVVAGFKYPSPILSLAVIPTGSQAEDRHLAVGLQTGLLSIRTRLAGTEKVKAKEKSKRMDALIAGTSDAFERTQKKKDMRQGIRARDRGKDFRGEGADIVITGNDRVRTKKLRPWQRNLREGKYALALDQVLGAEEFHNQDMLTLLTALRHRSALRSALANRTPETLLPILQWVVKYVNHARYVTLVYDVVLLLLDMYSLKLEEWLETEDSEAKDVRNLVRRLGRRVRKGADYAGQAHGTLAMLGLIEGG